ncbi:MAG: hypothetical protein AABZ32_08155 [Bacteroidota bacterium]
MNGSFIRTIGIKRATAVIGLMNLTYNIFRALQQRYVLQKNDDIKKQMQLVIDQKQNEMDELRKQVEEMKKIIGEKNFAIEVLRGER